MTEDLSEHLPERRNVYIIDDDRDVRRSLSFALATADFDVRAFVSGRDFLDDIGLLAPGCVLLDLRMPELGGLGVLAELGERRYRFPVIVITGYGDVQSAVQAMRLGAKDFLEKPFSDQSLLSAIAAVFATLSSDLEAALQRARAMDLVERLTTRERELLNGLVAGLSNKAVANELGVSVRTVEMHRANLMSRLGVKSLAEAVRIALQSGTVAH